MPAAGSQISRPPSRIASAAAGRSVGVTMALAILLAAFTPGCSTSPPEPEALQEAIQEAAEADPAIQLSQDQIACVARRLLDESGLSATTLNGLATDFDSPEVLSSESDRIQSVVAQITASCVAGG